MKVRTSPRFFAIIGIFTWAAAVGAATELRIVAVTGEQAPGMPVGIIFDEFNRPDINAAGETAFAAVFAGPMVTTSNDATLWTDRNGVLSQVVREGQQAVGLPNMVAYKSFTIPHLNDAGRLGFEALLSGPGVTFENDEAVFSEGVSNILGVVAREGDQVPGLGAGILYSGITHVLFNNEGRVVFSGQLKGTGVDVSNNACIWTGFPGAASVVVRENNPAPGLPAGVLFASTSSLQPVLGADDSCGFYIGLSGVGVNAGNDNVIYSGTTSTPAVVVREGEPAPGLPAGIQLGALFAPDMNAAGETAFVAFLKGNVTSAVDDRALFSEGRTGSLDLVARMGGSAPAGDFKDLFSPVICADGPVAFMATLQGSGIDGLNDECLCTDSGGTLHFVAREGEQAPGLPDGVVFAGDAVTMSGAFSGEISMNARAQIAFRANLAGPGIDMTNNSGIWLHDPDFGTRLVIRSGDAIEIATGDVRMVQDIIWVAGSGGSDGRNSAMNDSAQLALWLRFTDGSEAIVVTLDTDGDGTADLLDNCPMTVNMDQADADGDGVGDACDGCPDDADKLTAGVCGCDVSDADSDNDGVPDCLDDCPDDPDKLSPGACGCGMADVDSDGDLILDCNDNDPVNSNPGQTDGDGDGVGDTLMQPEQCCGGGMPVLTPFLLLGLRRRRRRKSARRMAN
ncbi:MAG: hypothetical protein H6818_19405 [Phycisphaerales bacterium]|nr:hypothetical protein [Phycisphaerales bacterium]MCB9863633.1 hypothetical protein [Phycisphaerales bacterium]